MTTPTQTHPSLEELAAFLDGKLEAEERARVIRHLDECPDCYETFAGTARFLTEEEGLDEQIQEGRVVPFPLDRTLWSRWLAAAAGVLLVAGLGWTAYVSLLAPPQMKVAELVQPLAGTRNVQIFEWETNRGVEEASSSRSMDAPSFLIGAWMVDRQVAINLGKAGPALDMSRRIWLALDNQGMSEEAAPFKEEAGSRLETRVEQEAFLERLRKAGWKEEESLASDNTLLATDYLAFGKWAEASRLAAASRDMGFFEDRDIRRFPSYFLRAVGTDLAPEVRKSLEQIRGILDDGAQPNELPRLETLLGKGDDQKGMTGLIAFYENAAKEGADDSAGDSGSESPL